MNIKSFAQSWDFGYNGGVQSWTCPATGTYKLETWGAQGGNSTGPQIGYTIYGGQGGYASGLRQINKGETLYLVIGGQGGSVTNLVGGGSSSWIDITGKAGGHNGGGRGGDGTDAQRGWNYRYAAGAGGGGATHIATTNRGVLSNYSSNRNEILLVAGGGGGAGGWNSGGAGGGNEGQSVYNKNNSAAGGTQSSGYSFGVGAPGDNGLQSGAWGDSSVEGRGGGGGGWYGGQRCTTHTNAEFTNLGGAGGSGHLGNVQSGSMTNGVRSGNGFARITSMHTHSYTKQVQDVAPTCTAAGSGHYECPTDGARNGATYSIPALGHSYGAWSGWAKYGNTTNHRRSRKCSRCGNIEYSYENHKDANNDGACDTCGEIYRSRHTLSIKGFLNGANQESINPYGLFTLKIDGRNIISNQTSWSGIIADGTAYIITPTANTGYQYMGIQGGSLSESMSASDKIIRLSFDNLYTIVFNGNNATGGSTSSMTSIPYTIAKNLTANGFYRNGYSFTGWTGNADGTGSSYSNKQSVSKLSATPNGVVNLYAKWTPVTYHIYYTLYGSSASVKRTYTITDNAFILPTPSLNGYTFKGWIGGVDKKDSLHDANGKTYVSATKSITIPHGTYGDYFFRTVFEKNHSVDTDGNKTDDVYVAHSIPQEKQY